MRPAAPSGEATAEAAGRGDGVRKSRRSALRPKIVRNRRLRELVFARDEGRCCDCGKYDPKWEMDHDLALWRGGADDIDNCVTRCRHCHLRKTVGETPIRAKADRLRARSELTKKRRALLRDLTATNGAE
jgi:5-methylcytosine-specific restriction endonuclease McrA